MQKQHHAHELSDKANGIAQYGAVPHYGSQLTVTACKLLHSTGCTSFSSSLVAGFSILYISVKY